MKQIGNALVSLGFGFLLALVAVAGLAGCASSTPKAGIDTGAVGQVPTIRVGETITVTISDIGISRPILPFEDKVKEDGSVTLHLNQSFIAAGKTALQLQKEIYARYVPDFYQRMTVTVKTADLFYTVLGQVKLPSQYEYKGPIKVTQAIATAGDFTDFAAKTRVKLIRSNGEQIKVDCVEALKDPAKDPMVYPGDTINVPRRTIGLFD